MKYYDWETMQEVTEEEIIRQYEYFCTIYTNMESYEEFRDANFEKVEE